MNKFAVELGEKVVFVLLDRNKILCDFNNIIKKDFKFEDGMFVDLDTNMTLIEDFYDLNTCQFISALTSIDTKIFDFLCSIFPKDTDGYFKKGEKIDFFRCFNGKKVGDKVSGIYLSFHAKDKTTLIGGIKVHNITL